MSLFSAKLEKVEIKRDMLKQVDAKLTQELSDSEKKIIFFTIRNKKITSADSQKLLNISREMTNRYFRRLIEKRLLIKGGAGKSTFHFLSGQITGRKEE